MKVRYCVRYADDFVIMHADKQHLKNLLPALSDFLATQMKLSFHPDKVSIRTFASGVDFLGWVHFPHRRTLRTATKRRMIRRLGDHPSAETATSYLGLLGHGNTHKLKKKLFGE